MENRDFWLENKNTDLQPEEEQHLQPDKNADLQFTEHKVVVFFTPNRTGTHSVP